MLPPETRNSGYVLDLGGRRRASRGDSHTRSAWLLFHILLLLILTDVLERTPI